MDPFTDIVVWLVGPAIIGLVGWVWRVHAKTYTNQIALINLERDVAKNYMAKEVEEKIFRKLDQLAEAVSDLRTEVRVAVSKRAGENGLKA